MQKHYYLIKWLAPNLTQGERNRPYQMKFVSGSSCVATPINSKNEGFLSQDRQCIS